MKDQMNTIVVWDKFVRFFHFSLVLCFVMAWFSSIYPGFDDIHVMIGYFLSVLLIFRVYFGFYGLKYANFASFSFTPSEIGKHVTGMFKNKPEYYLGHSPLGSLMVFTLLILLLLIVSTGYVHEAWSEFAGPLWWMGLDVSEAWGEMNKTWHHFLPEMLWFLVALHVIGVITAMIQHRENLILSILTGRKVNQPKNGNH